MKKGLSFFVSSKYDMSFKILGDLYLEQHTRFFEINEFLTMSHKQHIQHQFTIQSRLLDVEPIHSNSMHLLTE